MGNKPLPGHTKRHDDRRPTTHQPLAAMRIIKRKEKDANSPKDDREEENSTGTGKSRLGPTPVLDTHQCISRKGKKKTAPPPVFLGISSLDPWPVSKPNTQRSRAHSLNLKQGIHVVSVDFQALDVRMFSRPTALVFLVIVFIY